MNTEIYDKLFQDEVDFSKPVVCIKKEAGKYVAYNIKSPRFYHSFDSIKEFLSSIGSAATRPTCFDNQTGEDIFKGY